MAAPAVDSSRPAGQDVGGAPASDLDQRAEGLGAGVRGTGLPWRSGARRSKRGRDAQVAGELAAGGGDGHALNLNAGHVLGSGKAFLRPGYGSTKLSFRGRGDGFFVAA